MRFALIAMFAAGLAAAPFVAVATAPSMSQAEFVAAARCAAFESVVQSQDAGFGRRQALNIEARRQDADSAAQAQAQIDAVYAYAREADPADMHRRANAACGQAGAIAANRTLAPDAA